LIHKFKEMGRSVLIISHDLDEIVELADSLTILRDGRVVDTVTTNDLSMEQLKRMMVGREMAGDYYRVDIEPSRSEKIVISVRNLKVANEVKGLSFEVHEGEILGLCGLSDSGIHAIGKAMYGLESDVEGDVILHTAANDSVKIDSSRTALCHGMAYVPKERDGEGLMLHASIRDNLCLPSLNELTDRVGMLWQKQKNLTANRAKDEFSVRCQDVLQEVGGLSGGNKQKINLGRWLAKDLTLLILDCPTRGVDIGVKAYIYGLMKDLKAKGLAIVLISDELLEVLGMSDRILVIKNGELAEEVPRGMRFSEEEIIEVML
jgi:ribose transport system ATP-binding protein